MPLWIGAGEGAAKLTATAIPFTEMIWEVRLLPAWTDDADADGLTGFNDTPVAAWPRSPVGAVAAGTACGSLASDPLAPSTATTLAAMFAADV